MKGIPILRQARNGWKISFVPISIEAIGQLVMTLGLGPRGLLIQPFIYLFLPLLIELVFYSVALVVQAIFNSIPFAIQAVVEALTFSVETVVDSIS